MVTLDLPENIEEARSRAQERIAHLRAYRDKGFSLISAAEKYLPATELQHIKVATGTIYKSVVEVDDIGTAIGTYEPIVSELLAIQTTGCQTTSEYHKAQEAAATKERFARYRDQLNKLFSRGLSVDIQATLQQREDVIVSTINELTATLHTILQKHQTKLVNIYRNYMHNWDKYEYEPDTIPDTFTTYSVYPYGHFKEHAEWCQCYTGCSYVRKTVDRAVQDNEYNSEEVFRELVLLKLAPP